MKKKNLLLLLCLLLSVSLFTSCSKDNDEDEQTEKPVDKPIVIGNDQILFEGDKTPIDVKVSYTNPPVTRKFDMKIIDKNTNETLLILTWTDYNFNQNLSGFENVRTNSNILGLNDGVLSCQYIKDGKGNILVSSLGHNENVVVVEKNDKNNHILTVRIDIEGAMPLKGYINIPYTPIRSK